MGEKIILLDAGEPNGGFRIIIGQTLKINNNMSFKKNPTIEDLQNEVELLQEQVITGSAQNKALSKALKNHPAQVELDALKAKWWHRFFKFLGL